MAKFELDRSKCIYCGGCVSLCPALALTLNETRLTCDENLCIACRACEKGCPVSAIKINAPTAPAKK